MKEKEHNYKLKISLKLNNYKFSPSEEVEGTLIIYPNQQIKLSNVLKYSEFYIILKEKVAYKYFDSCSKTFIIEQKLLKIDNKNIDDNNILKIPIKYKLPDSSTKNFYPSFRYFTESIKCLVSHSLIVEIPFITNKASVNIFIRKMPKEEKNKNNELNKDIFGDELIKKFFWFNSGKLSYYIKAKESISYREKYPVEIHIDQRDLGDIQIESINMKIQKQIYFYNEVNIFTAIMEENYDIKELKLNSNQKNNIIIENFELPLTEFSPLSLNDILKINYNKSNFNFTPPVDNFLFSCNYYFQLVFKFDSSLIEDKIVSVPIDYYDIEYNNKKKENNKNEIDNNIDENIIYNDNDNDNYNDNDDDEFNKIFINNKDNKKKDEINEIKNNNNNKNDNNDKNDNDNFGFFEITKEDFIKTIDGNN